MAKQTINSPKRGAGFLTRQEINKCKVIAAAKAGIYSQRAQALLLLHEGSTQKETGEKCKLTLTQISYLRTSFKNRRLSIFPQELFLVESGPAIQTKAGKTKKDKPKEKKKDKSKKKKSEKKKSKKKADKKNKDKKSKKKKKKSNKK